jgi:hypothetical protein
MLKGLLAGAAAVLLAACASTTAESSTYKSPTAKGHAFWKVAVWAQAGLAARQQTEAAVVLALRNRRIDAYASLAIWPIDAAEDEIQAKLKASDIDAVLVLAREQAASTVSSVGTVSTTALWGKTSVTNSAATAQVKDNAVDSVTLYNEASGRVVWQSQVFTAGNEFAGWGDINSSSVQKTASDLLAANVMYRCFTPPPPPPEASAYAKQKYADRIADQAPGDCPPRPQPAP